MGEWIDEKQNTHSWQIVSSAIRWHQTMRHEKMGGGGGGGYESAQVGGIVKECAEVKPVILPPCTPFCAPWPLHHALM